MGNKTFTTAGISKLKAPDSGRVERYDAAVPGFGVRVTASGAKSWIFLYSHDGRRRRYTIGTVDAIPLAQARAQAIGLKDRVKAGEDPAAEKLTAREKAIAESADRSNTFGAVVGTYFRRHGDKLARGSELRSILDREVLPHWRDRKVTDITRYDVAERCGVVIDDGKPAAANRLFETIRQVFNYAIEHALVRGLETAPTDRMKMPAARVKRERVLNDDEIKQIWKALDVMGRPFGDLYKVMLLTGQRLDETRKMRCADVNGDAGRWTIPAADAKNSQEHTVYLSPLANEIIARQPAIFGSVYVFAGRGENPASGHSKAKARLDELSGVTGWRLHDLRRTMRTRMAKLGVPVIVAERCLNHTIGGLVGVYDRHGYNVEMQAAWERWAAYVAGLVKPTEDDRVVPLRALGAA